MHYTLNYEEMCYESLDKYAGQCFPVPLNGIGKSSFRNKRGQSNQQRKQKKGLLPEYISSNELLRKLPNYLHMNYRKEIWLQFCKVYMEK
jgi:hypothetical protein